MQSYKYQYYDKKHKRGGGKFITVSNKKLIAIILVIAIVLNLILFAFVAISQLWFWSIIILIGIIAYKILPKLK